MAKEVRSSPRPVAALGQLLNWRPWTSQLRELTEVLPTLYATDALVAVERLSYWVDRLAALRTLAAIEARRQAAPAGRSAATPARADRRQRPGAAWTPARSRRSAC